MKKIKQFLVNMLSGNSDVSSKRVNGTLCIWTILIILITSVIWQFNISETQESIISTVFWGGIMLLGVGIADHYFKK